MSITVEAMLKNLEDILDESVTVPLSSKRLVDIDILKDVLDDIRVNLPQEILQAKAIVQDRTQIIGKANRQAEEIVRQAENRARYLTSNQEVLKRAEEKSKEIMAKANIQSNQLRNTVVKYCDDLLNKTQSQLQKSVDEIKLVKDTLKDN